MHYVRSASNALRRQIGFYIWVPIQMVMMRAQTACCLCQIKDGPFHLSGARAENATTMETMQCELGDVLAKMLHAGDLQPCRRLLST